MFGWLKNIRDDQRQRRRLRMVHVPVRVRGRYDAAATTDENRRHWANADLLSADAATNPQVRRILRNRARYEVANNSYARGIVLTLANDSVGTGPRLQMLTDDAETNSPNRAGVLPLGRGSRPGREAPHHADGAGPGRRGLCDARANPKVDSPVKLDLRLIEADQVTTPESAAALPGRQRRGRDRLRRLRQPGRVPRPEEPSGRRSRQTPVWITTASRPASMIHYFRMDRPGPKPRHPRDHAGPAAVRSTAAIHVGRDRRRGNGR